MVNSWDNEHLRVPGEFWYALRSWMPFSKQWSIRRSAQTSANTDVCTDVGIGTDIGDKADKHPFDQPLSPLHQVEFNSDFWQPYRYVPDGVVQPGMVDVATLGDYDEYAEQWREFILASVTMGVTAAGVLLHVPVGAIAIPLLVYQAWPSFEEGVRKLQDDQKLSLAALDSCLIAACIGNHFYFVSSLRFWIPNVLRQGHLEWERLHPPAKAQEPVVTLTNGSRYERASIHSIQCGDVLVIDAGDMIPINGTIVQGSALITCQSAAPPPDYGTSATAPPYVTKSIGDGVRKTDMVLTGQINVLVDSW